MASDADLLQRWRAGDNAAGNRLYGRCFPAVYRFFVNKTCTTEDTEELVRATFAAMASGRDSLPAGALGPYSIGVANQVLARYHRGLAHSNVGFDPQRSSILDLGAGAEIQLDAMGGQRLLLVALREIPAELQTVLELYYVEALEADAIGVALGMTTTAVRDRLTRAREHLNVRVGELTARARTAAPNPARWPDLIRGAFPVSLLSVAGSLDTT